MPFHAVQIFHVPELPIWGRVYIHSDGFKEVYGNDIGKAFDVFKRAGMNLIGRGKPLPENPDFFLASISGDPNTKERIINVLSYHFPEWNKEPFSTAVLQLRNELPRQVSLEELAVGELGEMLTLENTLRKKRDNKAEYILGSPSPIKGTHLYVPNV